MKRNALVLSVSLVALMAISGSVYARDGGCRGPDGVEQQHRGSECGDHKKLSESKRHLFHEAMKASFEKNKERFQEMHKLHKELQDVVKADRFDEKTFLNLSNQIDVLRTQIHEEQVKAFASVAGEFSPKERERLMRFSEARHHRHREHNSFWSTHRDAKDGHVIVFQPTAEEPQATETTETKLPGQDKDYPPYARR